MELPIRVLSCQDETVSADLPATDLVIHAQEEHRIGMIAHAINDYLHSKTDGSAPLRPGDGGPLTLAYRPAHETTWTILDACESVGTTSLRPGSNVCLLPAGTPNTALRRRSRPPAAWLYCTAPHQPRMTYPLHFGRNTVGRSWRCTVRVVDPNIARDHGELWVEPSRQRQGITITVRQGGDPSRVIEAEPQARFMLDTLECTVEAASVSADVDVMRPYDGSHETGGVGQPDRPYHQHLPASRFLAVQPQPTLQVPQSPTDPAKNRGLTSGLLISTAISAIAYLVTGHAAMLSMVGLSAVMGVGTWIEQWYSARRQRRSARRGLEAELEQWVIELQSLQQKQLGDLNQLVPDLDPTIAAALHVAPRLWSQPVTGQHALRIRIGETATDELVRIEGLNDPPVRTSKDDYAVAVQGTLRRHLRVRGVPVWLSLREAGVLGIAGTSTSLDEVVRTMMVQLATWHSPHRLTITVLDRLKSGEQWGWIKWLPHVADSSGVAAEEDAASQTISDLETEVMRRSKQLERDGTGIESPVHVLLVRSASSDEISRLVTLARRGPAVGIYVIWCASHRHQLPTVCRWIVDVNDEPTLLSPDGLGDTAIAHMSVASVTQCEQAARSMTGVLDMSAAVVSGGLPRRVTWRDATTADLSDPDTIHERWQASDGRLACVLGQGETGPVEVSLRQDGPHALVAGTTGSGKSEFLQAMIMSLATRYSPRNVTFLLIDYKGGAAFRHCVDLPHTVGLITDLDDALVQRVLVSLRAELRHREQVLAKYQVKDLIELEADYPDETLAPLIIVIDEFAALVAEVPQFIDGVVDIAQRGRSLGLHLVLATQRPAGVIKDNVRANTSMRIALRVADDEDSLDVLGVVDAADIDRTMAGRGYLSTGPRRLTAFQSTYLGQASDARTMAMPTVRAFDEGPFNGDQETLDDRADPDIEVLVRSCIHAASNLGLEPVRRPWLDPLPEVLSAEPLWRGASQCTAPSCGCRDPDSEDLLWGRVDQPRRQRQKCLAWSATTPHLLVVGGKRSGKTTAIQTMTATITDRCIRNRRLTRIDVIAGDIGEHRVSDGLGSVGNVIAIDDVELVERLLRHLVQHDHEPRFLLVDGLERFIEFYEDRPTSTVLPLLRELMQRKDSQLRVMATSATVLSVYHPFSAVFSDRVTLHDSHDEAAVPDMASQQSEAIPGRGRVGSGAASDLLQLAVVTGADTVSTLNAQLISADLRATPIRRLPQRISRTDLDALVTAERSSQSATSLTSPTPPTRISIGLAGDDLSVVTISLDGVLVLCGPPGSGRSTLLSAILSRIGDQFTQPAFFSGLSDQALTETDVDWRHYATGPQQVEAVVREIADSDFIVIADAHHFADTSCDEALASLLGNARRRRVPVIIEIDTLSASRAWAICAELKTARNGVVLCPDDLDPSPPFHAALPRSSRSDFPPGRGFIIRGDSVRLVQCALS